MKKKFAIMCVTFVGLHVPLVVLTVTAAFLDLPHTRLILGVTLVSTLASVVGTLSFLHVLLPRDDIRQNAVASA